MKHSIHFVITYLLFVATAIAQPPNKSTISSVKDSSGTFKPVYEGQLYLGYLSIRERASTSGGFQTGIRYDFRLNADLGVTINNNVGFITNTSGERGMMGRSSIGFFFTSSSVNVPIKVVLRGDVGIGWVNFLNDRIRTPTFMAGLGFYPNITEHIGLALDFGWRAILPNLSLERFPIGPELTWGVRFRR